MAVPTLTRRLDLTHGRQRLTHLVRRDGRSVCGQRSTTNAQWSVALPGEPITCGKCARMVAVIGVAPVPPPTANGPARG